MSFTVISTSGERSKPTYVGNFGQYDQLLKPGMWQGYDEMKRPYGQVIKFHDIYMVEAEGKELNFILTKFRNIPYVPGLGKQTWTGDFAKFIYLNL